MPFAWITEALRPFSDHRVGSLVPPVFVVDDDASVRRALARLFTSLGLLVETFADAAEFLARAPGREHGCLLLDIKMPKTTGLDLQREGAGARG